MFVANVTFINFPFNCKSKLLSELVVCLCSEPLLKLILHKPLLLAVKQAVGSCCCHMCVCISRQADNICLKQDE